MRKLIRSLAAVVYIACLAVAVCAIFDPLDVKSLVETLRRLESDAA
jgi:hypothetical protein